ncbi:MAG TPA: hypothetical protein VGR48_06965 [Terriglobales bacterium]|nr:hypothetical protein [Terriglobales bacterium]
MPELPAPRSAAPIPEKQPAAASVEPSPLQPQAKGSEVPWYALAVLFGALSGVAEVAFGDLMLTAFLALFFCMVMGSLRPARPWRWMLIVCGCIPLSRLIAAGVFHMYTERAQIYEAFASFITGNAGAYVGALGRRRADDLWRTIRTQK